MSEHFVLVTYDISDDRRRTRLHDRLLAFGTPVQYSVFECQVDAEGLKALHATVRRTIRPRLDRVRFYRLCGACRSEVETTSGPEPFAADDIVVV